MSCQKNKRIIRKREVKEQRKQNCVFTWWWKHPKSRCVKKGRNL